MKRSFAKAFVRHKSVARNPLVPGCVSEGQENIIPANAASICRSGLGLASAVVALTISSSSAQGATFTFTNPAAIPLFPTSAFGNAVDVTGVTGDVKSVEVTVSGLSTPAGGFDSILLLIRNVATNEQLYLLGGVDDPNPVSNVTLRFGDGAPGKIPSSGPASLGYYQPSYYFGPRPNPYNIEITSLNSFATSDVNGQWLFFALGYGGERAPFPYRDALLTGGYSLTFVTDDVSSSVPELGTWAMYFGGLGLAGGAMRKRRKLVNFA